MGNLFKKFMLLYAIIINMVFKRVKESIDFFQKNNFEKTKDHNPIISLIEYDKLKINKLAEGELANVLFAVKDNINVEGHLTTSGSNILRNYRSNYNAFVIKKLINKGAIPVFKTNMDELGMGGDGLKSHYGAVKNWWNPERIIGGSSSGSAYLVSRGIVDFALGSDTGDSVRKPASYNGIVGYKPTWGLVSRSGLNDFAPSLDTIGWFTRTLNQAAVVADELVEYDDQDGTSIAIKPQNFYETIINLKKTNEKLTIGVSFQILDYIKEDAIKKEYLRIIAELKAKKHKIVEIEFDLDILSAVGFVYKIISSVEAISSNYNLTGWLFGNDSNPNESDFETKIANNRAKGFEQEVIKRFSIGNYYLDNFEELKKARKLRFLMGNEIKTKTSMIDAMIFPACIEYAPKINEYLQQPESKLENNVLTFANLGGWPSISLPMKNNTMPVGIAIESKPFNDLTCFKVAKIIEEI